MSGPIFGRLKYEWLMGLPKRADPNSNWKYNKLLWIFAGNSTALGGSSGGSRHLVEFRAGRMTMVGKMVHPDARKGLLYVYQAEDGLIHFCWKDRTTNKVEDDLIIFPDDCEFKRVEQCKTGRVFLLKFKSTSRRLFFWSQEPKGDKDEEWCRRINDVMNNPPTANSLSSTRGGSDNNEFQYMLNTMSQQQLMQLFGGVGQIGGLSNFLGTIKWVRNVVFVVTVFLIMMSWCPLALHVYL